MAGLYIHIPFCKSRCIYCGFYSTTLSQLRGAYINAVCREMELREELLKQKGTTGKDSISTVYLGGGTPSQLIAPELRQLFYYINKVYAPAPDSQQPVEITMECNPDDITPEYAALLSQLPVNRVSLGVQTFDEQRLRFLHRRHTAAQVHESVALLRHAGIANISIDLMFGFPEESIDQWQHDIDEALQLRVEHISAYSLMYEEGTPLYQLRSQAIGEELSVTMYNLLIDRLAANGYEHYEISNFARPGFRSLHNSNYWHAVPYIGLGAAAHSYDIGTRSWNVADVRAYIDRINHGKLPIEETEVLTTDERYDDRVMTGLRTREGISLSAVDRDFGPDYRQYLLDNARKYLATRQLEVSNDSLRLTREGLFVSDMIMSDLMRV